MKRITVPQRIKVPPKLRAFRPSRRSFIAAGLVAVIIIGGTAAMVMGHDSKESQTTPQTDTAKPAAAINQDQAQQVAGANTPHSTQPNASTGSGVKPSSKNTTSQPAASKAGFSVVLTQSSVSVEASKSTGAITASTSNGEVVYWSAPSTVSGLRVGQPNGLGPVVKNSFTFAVYTDATLAPGTYQQAIIGRTTATRSAPALEVSAYLTIRVTAKSTFTLTLLDTDATVNDSGIVTLPFSITRHGGHSSVLFTQVSFAAGPVVDGGGLSYSAFLPSNSSTGNIGVTVPSSAPAGEYYFRLNVSDNQGNVQEADFVIEVQ
jgi:hypothetical protein